MRHVHTDPSCPTHFVQLSPGRLACDWRECRGPGVHAVLASYRHATAYHAGFTQPEGWTLLLPLRRFAPGRLNAQPWHGEAWLLSGGQAYDALIPPIDLLSLRIDRAELGREWDDGAWMLPGIDARRMAHQALRQVLRGDLRAAVSAMALIAEAFRGRLSALSWSTQGEALDVVRRARQHAVTQGHRPLQVAEMCEVLQVSRRKLQYCFRAVLDTTPLHYLHALRLGGARRALLEGAPQTLVRNAAIDWGFSHLGRFSEDYRRLFGELPSETMRRVPTICQMTPARSGGTGGTLLTRRGDCPS